MNTISLYCPNCGAPLSFSSEQMLTICVYCNSSIRISHREKSAPSVNLIPEISSEVVDEVKRLIIMGFTTKAVDYYINKSGLGRAEAVTAVKAIKKTTGYMPPMNTRGLVILASLVSVSITGFTTGAYLLYAGLNFAGCLLIAVSSIFAFMNWFAFHNSLNSYFILRNGLQADAEILKVWIVKSYSLKGGGQSFLMRLLVKITPEGSSAYQAEVNCLVADDKKEKFNTGSVIKVKYKLKNPAAVIVAGTA